MPDPSFLERLFSSEALMPHGTCLIWRPDLVWLHAASDLMTALAYYSIPFALLVFAWRRRDLRFRWMFVLFGVFIMACGTTHLMSLRTLYVPEYGLQGVIKAVTALASVATAAILWPLIPKALAIPGPAQWQGLNAELRAQVDERRAAEQQVRRLNRDLERRVEERTAELREANARLETLNRDLVLEVEARRRSEQELRAAKAEAERADRAKTRFMAAANHDLRQPVQALVLLTECLAHRPDLDGSPLVENIRTSVEGLQRLLEALLDVSRLDAGIVVPELQAFQPAGLLERLGAEYRVLAEGKGIDLRTVSCRAWCRSDPALLERVLRNLIENAIRYTETGGVLVGCRRREGAVQIQVVDTGIGIEPDERTAIFQEFYQVGNAERDRRKGLGLGLSIVQRLAAILGHELTVASEVGKGTVFTLTIAACPPRIEDEAGGRASSAGSENGSTADR